MVHVVPENEVVIPVGDSTLEGQLELGDAPKGLVLFAHGCGGSRFSPRNGLVARALQHAGLGTLRFDLLTREEAAMDAYAHHLRFDIPFLAGRLEAVTHWIEHMHVTRGLPLAYFGSGTGGGAALMAAGTLSLSSRYRADTAGSHAISAVVLRGGRPDLAGSWLSKVACPVLFFVGVLDFKTIALTEKALRRMRAPAEMRTINHVTSPLFKETGTLEQVAHESAEWLVEQLVPG